MKLSAKKCRNDCEALCVKGYNLKHFVTAMPGIIAHNLFNDFNTDVSE
jgi:hypothetical protein